MKIKYYFWNLVHNCIAHPVMGLTCNSKFSERFHDWTARKMNGGFVHGGLVTGKSVDIVPMLCDGFLMPKKQVEYYASKMEELKDKKLPQDIFPIKINNIIVTSNPHQPEQIHSDEGNVSYLNKISLIK